jgi:glycosyltransferase involved in cell wall biosynthesis
MNSLVSIVIPCFNDGKYLREAVQSAERHPDRNAYEILIVNDGSSDALTLDILGGLESEGHRIINQANRGLSAARNAGIKAARGAYILPLDSDNRIRPDYISEGVRVLKSNPRVGVVYGDSEYFGDKTGINHVPLFSLGRLIQGNFIDACALYRRTVWEDVGGYDEDMRLGWEDWEFWLRIALKNWGFFHIDGVLFDYRVRGGSLVSTTIQHGGQICDHIFSKEELKNANAVRHRQLEIARLLSLERSPDYRLGHAVLNPLRKLRQLVRGKARPPTHGSSASQ